MLIGYCSLLPPPFHPLVAKKCIEKGTHMVTASYISEGMRSLDRSWVSFSSIFLLGF
jgi:saccharopine dehydrogenase-like NADP-dependent oxidoreductase